MSICLFILDTSDMNSILPRIFLGFSLYISNTTDKSQGTLCYKDSNYTMNTIPPVVNITCPVLGQYVIFYNERLTGVSYPPDYSSYAFNLLCEVILTHLNIFLFFLEVRAKFDKTRFFL